MSRLKRIGCLLLMVLMLITSVPAVAFADYEEEMFIEHEGEIFAEYGEEIEVFSQPSGWADVYVNRAIAGGLVPGHLQSHYTQATTRAEFAALAVSLYEFWNGEIIGRIPFDDTNDVNVQKAAYIGVVQGVGNNRFAPHDQLTREQAATMLMRLASAFEQALPEQVADFSDNEDIASWAVDAVGQMQATGIMGGIGNNVFSPRGSYTREQSIVTILRLLDFIMKCIIGDLPPPPDGDSSDWSGETETWGMGDYSYAVEDDYEIEYSDAQEIDAALEEEFAYLFSLTNTHRNTGNQRNDMVAIARTQVGFRETPGVATAYQRRFNSDGRQDWCAWFVAWVAREAGIPTSVIPSLGGAGPMRRSVPHFPAGRFVPRPGDLMFQHGSRPGYTRHVAIVESVNVTAGTFYVIHGNWGGRVARTRFALNDRSLSYFGVPNYTNTGTSGQFGTVTIQYNVNGGTGAPANHSVRIGNDGAARYTLSNTRPIRNGHTFTGWRRTNVSPDTLRQPGTALTHRPGDPTRNVTITYAAQWRVNVPAQQPVTIRATAGSGGTASGGGTVNRNVSVSLRATPNSGFAFIGWFDGNTMVNTQNPWTFNASANRTLQARFLRLTTINPAQQRFATANNVWTRSAPYGIAVTEVHRNLRHDEMVMVNATVRNSHNNLWYRTTAGRWIYSGNLSRTNTSFAPPTPQPTPTPTPTPNRTVTVSADRTTGVTSDTIFRFTANTNFDATRVIMTFSGGGQIEMNRGTNARTWTLNTRLTVAGTQTITVHAYEGSTRRASNSMTATTQPNVPTPQFGRVTIQYNTNGGTGAPASHSVQIGNDGVARYTLSSVRPTRAGHTFTGWRRTNVGPDTLRQPGTSLTHAPSNPANNVTINYAAQWQPNAPTQPNRTVTVSANRTTGTTSDTIFNFVANTNFDATRVVITFSGGGQFNMNRGTSARNWTLNSRLTVAGTQTVTVHAYEGTTRRASHSMTVSSQPAGRTVTVSANRTTGITSSTIFNFVANTNFDATRVVITFSGGGQFNMNRGTSARNWTLNSRLTVPGTQTITVHAYEGNVRRASHSMTATTTR